MEELLYNNRFYENVRLTAEKSVNSVLEALKQSYTGEIHSAVDLGCGTGGWLQGIKAVFDENAIIYGYDGDYVDRKMMAIPEEHFEAWDLTKPIQSNCKYDLAISLEVIEHLPEESSDVLLNSLTSFSDLILFSAAVPCQGGTGHVNERPISYWIEKFEECGYEFHDVIRPKVWNDKNVSFWYKQNIAVYVKKNSQASLQIIDKKSSIVDIIHPELLKLRYDELMRLALPDSSKDGYKRAGIIRDLFDDLPNTGVAIRMGGYHTERLLDIIGVKNQEKIAYIIDADVNCCCDKYGYKIILPSDIEKYQISTIILSSYNKRDFLLEESKKYPAGVVVHDLYQYLEERGEASEKEFFR